MALIKCKECEKEYSDKAEACPNCSCPTTSNTITEKRKEVKKCSVVINGDEKLEINIDWKGTFLLLVTFGIVFFFSIMIELELLLIVSAIFFFASPALSMLFPEPRRKYREAKIINKYFKERFILLNDMPVGYKDTKTVVEEGKDKDSNMFKIYMEAYKFNADAIVLNDSSISTDISSSTSGFKKRETSITSTNTYHITATLIKY